MKRLSHRSANLILDAEQVSDIAIEALRPKVESIFRTDQTDRDADAFSGSPYRPFQDSFDTELPSDLFNIPRLSFEARHHASRGDPQLIDPRQYADQLVGQSVTKVLILFVGRFVREGHHRHGGQLRDGDDKTIAALGNCLDETG